jgi:hypothetical protein
MMDQNIPEAPEELLKLAEKIIDVHIAEGINSPLRVGLVADLNFRLRHAQSKQEEMIKYKKLMESSLVERDNIMGLKNSCGIPSLIFEVYKALNDCQGMHSKWGFIPTE